MPLAIMLGLAGSTSAFLQNVRPTHLMVPAHKYQAAVSRARASAAPRAARSMRVMSATVDVEAADTMATAAAGSDEVVAAAVPEVPAVEMGAGSEAAAVPEIPAEGGDVSSAVEVREKGAWVSCGGEDAGFAGVVCW